MKKTEISQTINTVYLKIRKILETARSQAYWVINFAMVQAYWNIGRIIVEEEQKGKIRADYGEAVLEDLSKRLTKEFGKGFTPTNLRYMRQFFRAFPICHALRDKSKLSLKSEVLRPELSWTHYRLLLRVENEKAREWYMNETAEQNWSTRQLERQISAFYYERLSASRNKAIVKKEVKENLSKLESENFIHDPYVLEFLDLKDYPGLREKELETAIINT